MSLALALGVAFALADSPDTPPAPATLPLRLVPHQSTIRVRATSAGLFSAPTEDGALTFTPYAGTAAWTDDPAGTCPVSVALRLNTIQVPADLREWVTSEHQLNVLAWPEASWTGNVRGPCLGPSVAEGELSLRGLTRPQAAAVRVAPIPGGLRTTAHFSLSQADFGITRYRVFFGMVGIEDRVDVSVDLTWIAD